MKNLLTIFLLIIVQFAFGQSGSIQGQITDEIGEGVFLTFVELKKDGNTIAEKVADIDGNYSFHFLEGGSYSIKFYYPGYVETTVKKIQIKEHQIQILNIQLYQLLDMITNSYDFTETKNNSWDLTQGTTFSFDEIERSPHKN